MTAYTSWRRRSASVLATTTAVLLAVSGALMAPAIANADEPIAPTLTVEPNVDLNREGATVTITGTGYNPNQPIYVTTCADTALENLNFAYINNGCTTGAKQIALGATPSPRADAFQADGSFVTTLPVSPKAGAEVTSVFTIANHTAMTDRTQDAKAVLNFAPEVVPSGVSPSVTAAATTGLTVTTQLTGVTGTNGAYVAVIEAGTSGEIDQEHMGIGFQWVKPTDLTNGAGASVITIDAADLDRTKSYEVLVWKGHSMPDTETTLGLAALAVSGAQWDAVFPTVVDPKPELTATATAKLASSLVVQAQLKNIDSPTGAYVSIIEAGTAAELSRTNQGLGAVWVQPGQFDNGSATVDVVVPKKALDRTKQYEAVSWKGHTNPELESLYGIAELTIPAATWDAVMQETPFTDVKKGQDFYSEISWMFNNGITTGVAQSDGTVKYEPKWKISREAVAAFMYRQYGDPKFKAPSTSPFADVQKSDPFYKEIAWMAAEGISTGVNAPGGKVNFQPKAKITREAMAAFMYRVDDSVKPAAPKVSPFADMTPNSKFYKEIAWMHSTGLSTGVKQTTGKAKYEPKWQISREATAAFLARHDAMAK
ncbi:S-layer homology domain-containing protein [Leucobacter luti]|uniref:S-layer homology domain-containing protein n=1 Tax=Leucobacter luti TaxID=340320 RepID=UPI001C68A8EE|nr:S-layer homology domain-containing protein [Leucobacter luti]QYM75306.1 S-layer homology domain-containing protein [Leucobacter luti]